MAEIEQTMRVVMDVDAMHRLLDPILQEVNELRRRVKLLEERLDDDGR